MVLSLQHIWPRISYFGQNADMTYSMKLSLTPLLALRNSYTAPTQASQGSGDHTIQRATSLNASLSLANSNTNYSLDQASDLVNATLKDSSRIKCDGQSYGFDPNIPDCMTAIQYFLPSREQTTYAQRGSPAERGSAYPLPLRIMGGMLLLPQ